MSVTRNGAATRAGLAFVLALSCACSAQDARVTPAQAGSAQPVSDVTPTRTPTTKAGATRMERTCSVKKRFLLEAYWRSGRREALENFQISGVAINHYPGFVEGFAIVKLAAAQYSTDVGAMKKKSSRPSRRQSMPFAKGNSRSIHRRLVLGAALVRRRT